MENIFTPEKIKEYLKNDRGDITLYQSTDSTNLRAMDAAKNGAPHGTVIAASHQSAGRGRLGRSFFSPEGYGIYFSVIIRQNLSPDTVNYLTPLVAVAVYDALASFTQKDMKIKWVNDIYADNKKVCGILVQSAAENGGLAYAVIGVGINLWVPENSFPEEIADIAGGAFHSPFENMRSKVCASAIDNILEYTKLPVNTEIIEKYRALSWLDGKEIFVLRGDSKTPAKALSVDGQCRLEVVYPTGEREFLNAGDVSIRKNNG